MIIMIIILTIIITMIIIIIIIMTIIITIIIIIIVIIITTGLAIFVKTSFFALAETSFRRHDRNRFLTSLPGYSAETAYFYNNR